MTSSQYDNSRIPGAEIVKEWFRNGETLSHMDLPLQSPDLKPTENI